MDIRPQGNKSCDQKKSHTNRQLFRMEEEGQGYHREKQVKEVWAEPDPVTKKDKEQNGQEEWRPGVGEESSPVDSTDRRAHHQQQPSCNTHG